jgi:drug/metabolite transporter (DMT)-like permease
LSLVTTVMWGVLPLALGILLDHISAFTSMTVRFVVAALFLIVVLGIRRDLPKLKGLARGDWGLLLLAILGLAGNYLFFQLGVHMTTPATAQLLIQISPVMFLLGSIFFFKERLVKMQWVGLFILLCGFGLYFWGRGNNAEAGAEYGLGVVCILIASVTWAAYALAQKQLLTVFKSQPLMMLIYAGGFVAAVPFADLPSVRVLDGLGIALLTFAAFNTIIAYGAFAEALAHWEASRVSAVLALTPVLTLLLAHLLSGIWPAYVRAETLSWINVTGAVMVVSGSMVAALGRR